jgi:hypothetical protein
MPQKVARLKTKPKKPKKTLSASSRPRKSRSTASRKGLSTNSRGGVSLKSFKLRSIGQRPLLFCAIFALFFGVVGAILLSLSRAASTDRYLLDSKTPSVVDSQDAQSVELGVKFKSSQAGYVRGVRFYKSTANTGTHTGTLWTSGGTKLATGTFSGETATGWQRLNFASPVKITANTTYVVSYHTDVGHYSVDANFFANNYSNAPLTAPSSSTSGGNGVFAFGASSFPNRTYNATNYWVDVVFNPYVGTPPTTIFNYQTPANNNVSDTRSVELGTRFTTDKAGVALGVMFYKSTQNIGTHTGTLWKSDGTKLGSITFKNEAASGWVTAEFATPISLSANTSYVVSYHAPVGRYATNQNFFTQPYDHAPLHAPTSAGVYTYGSSTVLPITATATNFWVDVWFAANPDSSTTPPTPPPSTPTIDVKSKGAKGDGVTNDTSAIQSAINAATTAAAGGTRTNVYFPTGTYLVSGLLKYGSNITLTGDGSSSTIKNTTNRTDATSMMGPSTDGIHDTVIEKLRFDQAGNVYDQPYDSTDAWLISVNATRNVTVQDVQFDNVRTMAIWTDSYPSNPTTGHKALRNHVTSAGGDGLSYFGAFTDFTIQSNIVEHTQDDAIAVQSTGANTPSNGLTTRGLIADNTVKDCNTQTNYQSGEHSTPRGIVVWGASHIDVLRNKVSNTFASGILVSVGGDRASQFVTVGENTVTGAGSNNNTSGLGTTTPAYGIFVLSSHDITLRANTLSSNKHGDYNITTDSYNITRL